MPVTASRMSALVTMGRNLIATSIRDSPGITVLTSSSPLHIAAAVMAIKAESAVKFAKNILKKSCHEDPYLALLVYRNTPQQGHTYSPAQRLSRTLRDLVPVATSHLRPWWCRILQEENSDRRCSVTKRHQYHRGSSHRGRVFEE